MDTPSMESYLTGRSSEPPRPPETKKGLLPEGLKSGLILGLLAVVAYLLYDSYQFQHLTRVEISKLSDQIKALENKDKLGEARLSDLQGELSQTAKAAKAEIKKTAQQIQAESSRTKAELSEALASKADSSQVQAVKQETEAKIGQVTSEVGGVKSEVGGVKSEVSTVKTELASTRRDLEGTQRQLVDVRDTLQAAVARNSQELNELRRKGERDYFEFEINKKNVLTKIQDIRLALTKTDPKKGKYNVQIIVDDNRLEKRDRTVNEPVQFLVGRNRIRYELVVNWVQKDRVGGYLSIPKDKTLSAERATKQ